MQQAADLKHIPHQKFNDTDHKKMELQPRATNYIEDIEGAHATEPKLFKDSMRDTKDMVNVGHRIKPKNKD